MWRLLRENFPEQRFRRQVPIRHYVADFASHRARLVIEVDGGQHSEGTDAERTSAIEAEGYRVLRFWNNEVLENTEGVAASISAALCPASPPPNQCQVNSAPCCSGHAGGMTDLTLPSRGRALERDFISNLRTVATDPAARGLLDDAAVLDVNGAHVVLTHDMIVEGVHYLPSDPPEDVAWKLVAVNLSDLAAKGGRPLGLIAGYCLAGDAEWDRRFVAGLSEAARAFDAPLLGGDTVAIPKGSARVLGLTAIGRADHAPARSGAWPGDLLWVSGTIGDAGAGLAIAAGRIEGPETLAARYRRPMPRLGAGEALAPLAHAMMDVSDGLLIDASRMAHASGYAIAIDLARIPLSDALQSVTGADRAARLRAATAGDDYELLLAAPPERRQEIEALAQKLGLPLTIVGEVREGTGLSLFDQGEEIPLPDRLGYEHGA